jgi:hypothetical protein
MRSPTQQETSMSIVASRHETIRAVAARTLEHSPYRPGRRVDIITGATSLTQALIMAAGGSAGAGYGWAREPTESAARNDLHAAARGLLADAGVTVPVGACPCRVLAGWERTTADPATVYRLVGAHPTASHYLRVTAAPHPIRTAQPRVPAAA